VGYVVTGTKRLHHIYGVTLCEEGGLFILGPGLHYQENCVNSQGLYEQITFRFSADTLHSVLCSLNLNFGINIVSHHSCSSCEGGNNTAAAASMQLCDLFATIKTSMHNNLTLGNDVVLRIKLTELAFLILSSGDNCLRHKLLRLADNRKRHFLEVIYSNIFSNVTIGELAELTHRSLTLFKKDFRAHFGCSPHRWLVEQRLLHSRIMLSTTSATISEIANECLFVNVSHFIKLFKRRYGVTPTVYREMGE
jgi:AraC-like DNA-binding protein